MVRGSGRPRHAGSLREKSKAIPHTARKDSERVRDDSGRLFVGGGAGDVDGLELLDLGDGDGASALAVEDGAVETADLKGRRYTGQRRAEVPGATFKSSRQGRKEPARRRRYAVGRHRNKSKAGAPKQASAKQKRELTAASLRQDPALPWAGTAPHGESLTSEPHSAQAHAGRLHSGCPGRSKVLRGPR